MQALLNIHINIVVSKRFLNMLIKNGETKPQSQLIKNIEIFIEIDKKRLKALFNFLASKNTSKKKYCKIKYSNKKTFWSCNSFGRKFEKPANNRKF